MMRTNFKLRDGTEVTGYYHDNLHKQMSEIQNPMEKYEKCAVVIRGQEVLKCRSSLVRVFDVIFGMENRSEQWK